jgi:hypothetical protein
MSEALQQDWKPKSYITGKLKENELVTTDLTPWEPGMRGYAVDLPNGKRVEVFFTVPVKCKERNEFVKVEAEEDDVCAAVVELFGWVAGKSF